MVLLFRPGMAMRRSRVFGLGLLMVILLSSGCLTVGPDYVRPDCPAPESWRAAAEAGDRASPPTTCLSEWWRLFNDPLLVRLVDRAVAANPGGMEARARIREARARRGVSEAALRPQLDVTGSYTKSRSGDPGETHDLYVAGFDAGWELDLFGGNRRGVESAAATLASRYADLEDVLVSLVGEVARNYGEVRSYQRRIGVAEKNIALQQETLSLVAAKYAGGTADALVVEQARYSLAGSLAGLPLLKTGLAAAVNRVAVLLADASGDVQRLLETPGVFPTVPADIAVGVPAEVLRQRPDVRKAEHLLAARTADIGVAAAQLYPKLSLTGTIGIEATAPGSVSLNTWSGGIGPRISWPVFSAGAIRRNIEAQTAVRDQAFQQYYSTVLSAYEEVENALTAYGQELQRERVLAEGVASAMSAAELAEIKYRAGLVDFTAVIDAQRSLLSLEDQQIESQGAVLSDVIALYKSLGGGWECLSVAGETAGHNNTSQWSEGNAR